MFAIVDKLEQDQLDMVKFKQLAKEKIINLALNGKLLKVEVKDNVKDMFNNIKGQKKLYKKQKNDDKVYKECDQYNWIETKFSNLINMVSGNDLSPDKYYNEGEIPYITGASNIDDGKIIINRFTNKKYINSHLGDILFTCKGTIGKISINIIGDIHVARQIMAIHSFINLFFTEMYLSSIVSYLRKHAKSQIPGIDRDQILNAVIKVPSLEEQKLIVKKVQELFSLLD